MISLSHIYTAIQITLSLSHQNPSTPLFISLILLLCSSQSPLNQRKNHSTCWGHRSHLTKSLPFLLFTLLPSPLGPLLLPPHLFTTSNFSRFVTKSLCLSCLFLSLFFLLLVIYEILGLPYLILFWFFFCVIYLDDLIMDFIVVKIRFWKVN